VARRAFFSFHYERDIWRANVVRQSWLMHPDRETAGFWDASLWEEAKQNAARVRKMINEALDTCSVTVVLIGAETYQRKWVLEEITESHRRQMGMLGVYIHRIKDQWGNVDPAGGNPFDQLHVQSGWTTKPLSAFYPTYSWFNDEGYSNLGKWIEEARNRAVEARTGA
jgi:hypothetical protein